MREIDKRRHDGRLSLPPAEAIRAGAYRELRKLGAL